MSILVNLKDLSSEQKENIMKGLEFQGKDSQTMYAYDINRETLDIKIPYGFARIHLNIKPSPRDMYPKTTMTFTGTLRDYQIPVKDNAIDMLNKTGCCLLSLHVGWGKSILGTYLATKLRMKTLIVVNKVLLLDQWVEQIRDATTTKCQVLKPNMKSIDLDCDVYVINAINIPKISDEFLSTIGTCIIDEIHLIMAEKLFKGMFKVFPRYVIGLSATPYRPDGLNKLLHVFCGDDKLVEKLYKEHTVYLVRTGIKIPYEIQWNGKMDWNSLLTNQAENMERNKMIVNIIKDFPERHFLVLCKRVSHGMCLKEMLLEEGEHVSELLGSKTTFDNTARILVATTQKCGVGFSYSKLDALLLATDLEEYFIQYLGRVFRNPDSKPIIFDLVDNVPILNKHFQNRKKTYQESGGIITPYIA